MSKTQPLQVTDESNGAVWQHISTLHTFMRGRGERNKKREREREREIEIEIEIEIKIEIDR